MDIWKQFGIATCVLFVLIAISCVRKIYWGCATCDARLYLRWNARRVEQIVALYLVSLILIAVWHW